MASCIQIEGMLQSYVDDEASTSERLLIEEHLKACAACTEHLQATRATTAVAFEVLRQDQLNEDMTERVMAHLPEIIPIVSASAYPHRHENARHQKVGAWLGAAGRLIPVFTPIILLILSGLLWVAWPTFNTVPEDSLGMIIYSDGETMVAQADAERPRQVRIQGGINPGDKFQTGDKSRLLLGLAGPSHITIFENTSVEVLNAREIVLRQGRVFFDVFRESRQFQVHTPDGRITVLGTSFHVDIRDSGTEVTVVNGEVMLENESTFLRLHRNTQAVVSNSQEPVIRRNIDTSSYVRQARAVRPDSVAEQHFLSQIKRSSASVQTPSEQVFVVETGRRPVKALLLRWTPDPYTEGHTGYTVYVSDNAMMPMFKTTILPETFRDKAQSMVRLEMPQDMRDHVTDSLHITIMPNKTLGLVDTTFTEVAAVGGTS